MFGKFPNITGNFSSQAGPSAGYRYFLLQYGTGAFSTGVYSDGAVPDLAAAKVTKNLNSLNTLSANRSDSVYGGSTSVQPNAAQTLMIIKV